MNTNKIQEIIIPLEGVESEHCALIVDKSLDRLKGVLSHKVELNNQRAIVQTAAPEGLLPNIIQTIRDTGYGVITLKKSFPVLNMSCASCASSAQSILENQPGVVHASVNYANTMANLEYLPSITSPKQLKASLQNIGYDLMIEESEEAKDEMEDLRIKKISSLKTKTLASIALSLPVVVIGMFFMDSPHANFLMWGLSTPVIFVLGGRFFINAWKQMRHLSANMDTLVALSTGTAYFFSVFNSLFPQYWHERGLHAHVYFESASVVISFILLGKWLEENAKNSTSFALKKLMGLQPKKVTLVNEEGLETEIPVSAIQIGDKILVKPGDKIAVDGTLLSGYSYVDESRISGEPIPVEKQTGDKIYSGTINQTGSFQFIADKVGADTLLSQIIKMVQEAQGSKPPVQQLVDRVAGVFVPLVILTSLLTLSAWIVFGGENGFSIGLIAMVTVLVIACPCALGLATPTAIMVGIGKGAENGILIKDAESLELARNIDTVVLDKTGTITEGKPKVSNILWLKEDIEYKTALISIEKHSEHPLAKCIIEYYQQIPSVNPDLFESIPGMGVKAQVSGKNYVIGNQDFISKESVTISQEFQNTASQWLAESKTLVWFAGPTEVLALIAITDQIKTTSPQAVKKLQQEGIEVYMLTGDNAATAEIIARQAGILHYKAGVLPSEKTSFIQELQKEGRTVAMVGDGVNDSGALAQADVSIAMGRGSDIAMDVAKMTIISSDLGKIYSAVHLSGITTNTIRQNLFWAFVYNIIGIPIAAGILYPFNGFLLDPMLAGAAMALSSVSVVANSLRLKSRQLP